MRKKKESLMEKFSKNLFTGNKITTKQQSDYLLLIGKLLQNGFSLNQAIKCMSYLDKSQDIFQNIYSDLQQGLMITQALRHLKLSPVIENQLVISQMNGGLQGTIVQCGAILKAKAKQQSKLKELMTYPVFILGFLILMIIGMKAFIMPQFSSGGDTAMLDLIVRVIAIVVATLVFGLAGFIFHLRRKTEYQRAQILIKLPVVGKCYRSFYQFSILQGWGMQLSNGLSLRTICLQNQKFKSGSIQNVLATMILQDLNKGKSIREYIKQEKLLPVELDMIISLGGGMSELSQDLLLMSQLKFEETQQLLKKLLRMVQPILFGVIAIVILVTYLMILLPVYGMMKGMN
ncbi:type II secretion system F family protein [Companilactobacillus mishanensis]|nr:type II secretion system F family protein [Companilactobacillus mishanensis]